MSDADVRFSFDPVCPFAWMTSKWVRIVQEQRGYTVDWRFISLRMVNADAYQADMASHLEGHTAGLRLLRVAAAARDRFGSEAAGRFYAAAGGRIWDSPPDPAQEGAGGGHRGTPRFAALILADAGLPAALTGKDVGTPIIQFQPPDGMAFFGPVISRLPSPADAVRLWDHVAGLASFPRLPPIKRVPP